MEVPLMVVMVPQHHPLGEEAEVDFGAGAGSGNSRNGSSPKRVLTDDV